MPGRHLGDGAVVLGGQGLQHGRQGVPVQGAQPPYVLGKQVVVHEAPVLGSVDPDDVVVVEVLGPGPVPRPGANSRRLGQPSARLQLRHDRASRRHCRS